MKMRPLVMSFLVISVLSGISPLAKAQTSSGSGTTSTAQESTSTSTKKPPKTTSASYTKPDFTQRFHNYLFDTIGPYPLIGAAIAGGVNQATNTPPEWGGGAQAYSYRYASNFGINLVATTTRYGLAEIFREDTIYYRCTCSGFLPRFKHAVISTFTSRRGDDGHTVFSFPKIAAPYAGTMTAQLGWYPARYAPMDGFRPGKYLLLTYTG
jgi:hypothetical protein